MEDFWWQLRELKPRMYSTYRLFRWFGRRSRGNWWRRTWVVSRECSSEFFAAQTVAVRTLFLYNWQVQVRDAKERAKRPQSVVRWIGSHGRRQDWIDVICTNPPTLTNQLTLEPNTGPRTGTCSVRKRPGRTRPCKRFRVGPAAVPDKYRSASHLVRQYSGPERPSPVSITSATRWRKQGRSFVRNSSLSFWILNKVL